MKIVYHKTSKGLRKFRLNRGRTKRWLWMRQQVNHLITHDRINTTYDAAKHIRPTMERVITLAKKFVETENQAYLRRVNGILRLTEDTSSRSS